jgi:hypothetical protein
LTTSREAAATGIYLPGDDVLVSLPTGRPLDRHGLYVNFSHRFASHLHGHGQGSRAVRPNADTPAGDAPDSLTWQSFELGNEQVNHAQGNQVHRTGDDE